jgi:large subunit ribosomal protein L17
MRHRVHGRHLGRSKSHRRALFRNLMTDLFRYGRIQTTEAKAKAIRGEVEKVISLAKRASSEGDLSARRKVSVAVTDPAVARELVASVATRYAERQGGYVRLRKLGPRQGDGASMVQIELVETS